MNWRQKTKCWDLFFLSLFFTQLDTITIMILLCSCCNTIFEIVSMVLFCAHATTRIDIPGISSSAAPGGWLSLLIVWLVYLCLNTPTPLHAAQGNHTRHCFIVEPCRSELHCAIAHQVGLLKSMLFFILSNNSTSTHLFSTPALMTKC